jgi:hypothetical protein
MVQITDFNFSIPTTASGGVFRPIPVSPTTIALANFGLAVTQPSTDVSLTATVGITDVVGNPDVLFRIFRGTQVIFATRVSTVFVTENQTVTFHAVDANVPLGYFGYTVTAEAITASPLLNNAVVVGPITFSGTSLV